MLYQLFQPKAAQGTYIFLNIWSELLYFVTHINFRVCYTYALSHLRRMVLKGRNIKAKYSVTL
jgi:hypothetical protein